MDLLGIVKGQIADRKNITTKNTLLLENSAPWYPAIYRPYGLSTTYVMVLITIHKHYVYKTTHCYLLYKKKGCNSTSS